MNTVELCLPHYDTANLESGFVIVRKQGKGFVVDLLEPHEDTRRDTWAKVQGLAKFADAHGISFGRLMIARKTGDTLEVVDVSDLTTREKARSGLDFINDSPVRLRRFRKFTPPSFTFSSVVDRDRR